VILSRIALCSITDHLQVSVDVAVYDLQHLRMAAQLEDTMADLERSRADFERKALAVGAAL
jgi:hypothetical protein